MDCLWNEFKFGRLVSEIAGQDFVGVPQFELSQASGGKQGPSVNLKPNGRQNRQERTCHPNQI